MRNMGQKGAENPWSQMNERDAYALLSAAHRRVAKVEAELQEAKREVIKAMLDLVAARDAPMMLDALAQQVNGE